MDVKLVVADATLAHLQVIVIDFEAFTTNIIEYELFDFRLLRFT